VSVDFQGLVEFGEEGLHCDAHDHRFRSQANNPSHMFTCFGIALSLCFSFLFEVSVLGWGDEIQCTSCADACELQGFRLSREQKIGGEHAHVGQVKSYAHMEKNVALHLFLHP
jgi:hypothetical protein